MSKIRGNSMRCLTDTEAAYIAGIIDGEGHITVSKKKDHKGMRGGYAYRPTVGVSNTKRELLEWLHAKTGLGTVLNNTKPKQGHSLSWRWSLWSQQAGQLLRAVRPYLVIKRQQADLVLAFIEAKRDGVGRNGLSEEEWAFQRKTYQSLKELNVRGTARVP